MLVEVGRNVRVDLVLQPGEQTQAITVTGEIPAIDTTDATLGGTVTNEAINALPLNGRNFQRLLQLHPGVVTTGRCGRGIFEHQRPAFRRRPHFGGWALDNGSSHGRVSDQ